MAETVGGYVTIPCPDTIGEKIFLPVTVLTQGTTTNRDGLLELDCNSGGLDQGRLTITLNPDITTGGSTPNFTYTKIDGSDLFNTRFALYGWSISYPVEAT